MRLSRFITGLFVALIAAAAAFPQDTRADALILFRRGRELQLSGKAEEAQSAYREAIVICNRELEENTGNMESYVVKTWCLFRILDYQDVIDVGSKAMAIKFDARIAETMGEAYFYLGQYAQSLKYLQKYIENSSESGERVPTAYFFIGEIYQIYKKYSHADIAYSVAVSKEPSISIWWTKYAKAVEALGEWQRAFDLYGRALKLYPGSADALAGQARVKPKLGN